MTKDEKAHFFIDWQKQVNRQKTLEEKLRFCLHSMQELIEKREKVSFPLFWQMRDVTVALFQEKETVEIAVRAELWENYLSFVGQIKVLQKSMEHEANFVLEQISSAIAHLFELFSHFSQDWPSESVTLSSLPASFDASFYQDHQKKTALLQRYVQRARSLRKELLELNTRGKYKIPHFKKLREIEDQFFPQYKRCIRKINDQFCGDLEKWVKENKSKEMTKIPTLFQLQDSMKALQKATKELGLRGESFKRAQQILENFWAWTKVQERAKKEQNRANYERISQQLDGVEKALEKGKKGTDSSLKAIFSLMRSLDLDSRCVKLLRDRIDQLEKKTAPKKREDDGLSRQKEEEKKAAVEIKQLCLEYEKLIDTAPYVEVVEKVKALQERIEESVKSEKEQRQLGFLIHHLQRLLLQKKQAELFSRDKEKDVNQLQSLLKEQREQQALLKQELDILRKEQSLSHASFESSLAFSQQQQCKKEQWEALQECIEKIEMAIESIYTR